MRKTKKQKRPAIVQIGSARVLIYRQHYRKKVGRRKKRYVRFNVVHYQGNGEKRLRIRQSFSALADARFEARRIAIAISNGEADVLKLTSSDRASYLHAIEALRPLKIPLHVAIEEYIEARQHAGAGVIAASKEYAQRHSTMMVRKPVADVVRELLSSKEQDGMSTRYLESLRSHLNRFSEHFQMNISAVTTGQIEDWLRRTKSGPRTRNNTRLSIVTLFNFAKARGYLPKMVETEAHRVAKAKDRGGEIGIFRPDELARMLIGSEQEPSKLDDEAKLYVALGAFTGLRSAELIRLEWDDVNFTRGHIEVGKRKSKTATRRLVPIQPNLLQWLAPYSGRTGPVFVSERAASRTIAKARDAGNEWPNNVLRHSYATYRLAQCQDAPRVALEMGNSPAMLFRNYRELADEKEAADWFDIVPPAAAANVIPIREAASRR
ncbi:MAG TPA: site-specific integrase [Chthoniobacterales bacterium]|nr:site-specific integrase [Chthoniobacterales bacterium]